MNQGSAARRVGLWVRPYITVFDPPLIAIVGCLCVIGIVTLYSAGNDFPWRVSDQLRNFGIALAVMFVIANVSPQMLMRIAVPIYLVGLALLVATTVNGVIVKGAQRWLDIGVGRIQPAEIMKLGLPLMLAWYFHKREGSLRTLDFVIAALIVLVPVGLIVKQPDLGTALLVLAAGSFVIFFAGLPWKWLAVMIVGGIATLPLAWTLMHDYQRERILTLIDPSTDPLGKGFHTLQAMIAIGSGGLLGKGWMQGTQTHLEFIPERTSDFIFAVYSEEFGLVGNAVMVVLFIALVWRALAIALNAPTLFARLLAAVDRADHLHLCVRQHGHGERNPAGGGRTAALHQLWRDRTGHARHGLRDADVDRRQPQAGPELMRYGARRWPVVALMTLVTACGTAPPRKIGLLPGRWTAGTRAGRCGRSARCGAARRAAVSRGEPAVHRTRPQLYAADRRSAISPARPGVVVRQAVPRQPHRQRRKLRHVCDDCGTSDAADTELRARHQRAHSA